MLYRVNDIHLTRGALREMVLSQHAGQSLTDLFATQAEVTYTQQIALMAYNPIKQHATT